MKKRKKLPPIFMRREDEPDWEREIWQPDWQCFCCEDTGEAIHAARMFIEGYDWHKHKLPVCQNPGCTAGARFGDSPALQASLDWRLDGEMCAEVDRVQRELWRQEVRRQQQQEHRVKLTSHKSASICGDAAARQRRKCWHDRNIRQCSQR